jgi:thioesterase domain-containing protein
MSSSPGLLDNCRSPRPWSVYPASLAQRRLWFLNELQAPTSAYNVNIGLWLYGRLDLPALESSLQKIVDRHDTLRTTFALQGIELLQLVRPDYDVSLCVTDFSQLEDPYPAAYEFAKREVAEPFDLRRGPLFRAKVMRIRPEEHVLLCTMHHTITDAWSMQIFTRELVALYEAGTSGSEPQVPDLIIQYGDFADWQQQLFDGDYAQNQLAYWKRTLAGTPSLLRLPTDHQRPTEQSLSGSSHTFPVPGEIVAGALSVAAQQKVTTFMLLLAAFKVLLARYSNQTDICVGVPVAGRTRVETEPLIGFFVDTLVFRDDLSGNPRFIDFMAKVRETTIGALANADVPFERLVEILHPERNLSYNPIFQVMFSVIKSAIRSHAFGPMVAYPYVVDGSNSILDLCTTFIEDSDGKWWFQIDFDTSLFKIERIFRMFEDYMEVLRQIIACPEVRIEALLIKDSKVAEEVPSLAPSRDETAIGSAVIAQGSNASYLSEREVLREIWKDVLGIERVGLTDNFFDIGGHSLLAAHLAARIQQVTGRRIPVSAIFRAPTVERLTALLHDNSLDQPDPTLMPLSQGTSEIPFFAIAEPGVDSLGYAMLARTLGQRHSVYKLQGAGTRIRGRPFEASEIQTLAEQYVTAMRRVQPRGPYCLGGMCNGVLIAQEMVQQLESEGEQVALFAILDTWVLENSQVKTLWKLNYYRDRIRKLSRLPVREQMEVAKRVLRRYRRRQKQERTGKTWSEAYWPGGNFWLPRFAAPVLLFKRPRQPFYYVPDAEMGWGKRSAGGVEICNVNCEHHEFLRQPYVTVVSEKLSSRLDEIKQGVVRGIPTRSLISIPTDLGLATTRESAA